MGAPADKKNGTETFVVGYAPGVAASDWSACESRRVVFCSKLSINTLYFSYILRVIINTSDNSFLNDRNRKVRRGRR